MLYMKWSLSNISTPRNFHILFLQSVLQFSSKLFVSFHPQSFPAAGISPSPPPVPPFPFSSSSLFSSNSNISFRCLNSPLLSSSALSDHCHNSSVLPNPFLSATDGSSFDSHRTVVSSIPSAIKASLFTPVSCPASLFYTSPSQQNISLLSSYSHFPHSSKTLISPSPHSSIVATGPASLPCVSPSELPSESCLVSRASCNPWGAIQVNIASVSLPSSNKVLLYMCEMCHRICITNTLKWKEIEFPLHYYSTCLSNHHTDFFNKRNYNKE